jgi:hypothetical protein
MYSHTKILGELELLICSGLESKHKYIVNKSIQLWNSVFGECRDGLEYPEQVKAALLKLRPIADIQLPFFPESLKSELLVDQRQPTDFTDNQDESSIYSESSSVGSTFKQYLEPHPQPSVMRRIRQSTPQVIIQVGGTQPRKRSRDATPDTSNRKCRKREVTPRLRHDDSQVQFEAIESSPMADRVVDSQLLTDKQKEVKERQQAEAAMFPDLRSSPLPKAKSIERSVEDPELPIHRSSSKIRAMLSPNVLRQTTPTLVLPSDDDNQVPSSPTPTRSLRGETQAPDPPSSPPEAVQNKGADYSRDLSSSSPEGIPEIESDGIMSLGPSAQVDPYAVGISDRTISTLDSNLWENGSSLVDRGLPLVDPSNQLQDTEAEHQQRVAGFIAQLVEESGESVLEASTKPQLPGTPSRSGIESTSNQQTPKTPQFVDARSSPASSDKISANGDVFEDAVSFPRLNIIRTNPKESSSPLSDADDSSMLRLVAEYDEGSGRVARQVLFAENKENQAERKLASLARRTSSPAGPSPRKLSLRNRSTTQSEDKESSSTSEVRRSSSDPSLIPETPAARLNETSMKIIIDGEEFDREDTIIADTSSLERLDGRPTAKRRGPPKKAASNANKRKVLADDADEVLDSQEVEASGDKKRKRRLTESKSVVPHSPDPDATVASMQSIPSYSPYEVLTFTVEPSPKTTSTKKKRQARRPKRASQILQEADAEAEQSQSPSMDIDASMPHVETKESAEDLLASDAKETPTTAGVDNIGPLLGGSHEMLPTREDLSTPVEDITITATSAGLLHDVGIAHEPTDGAAYLPQGNEVPAVNPGIDPVEETIVNESPFNDESSPPPEASESEDDPSAEIILTTTSGIVDTRGAAEEGVSMDMPNEAEPGLSTLEITIEKKLASLIDDLKTAALSREGTRHIEDLFYDAKEQLYGAERRGRQRDRREINM